MSRRGGTHFDGHRAWMDRGRPPAKPAPDWSDRHHEYMDARAEGLRRLHAAGVQFCRVEDQDPCDGPVMKCGRLTKESAPEQLISRIPGSGLMFHLLLLSARYED